MIQLPDQPFHYRDVARLGLTRSRLATLLKQGMVRRLLHAVYVRSDVEDTIELRAAAALLVLPSHAVVCDRSAAWVHGVDSYQYRELEVVPVLEVVSIEGHEPARRRGYLAGRRDLLPSEICIVGGIPVTTPVRTACDLACQRGRSRALAVLDAFRRRHGLTCTDYARQLERFRGRRGVIQARELAALAIADAESPAESWLRMTVLDEGFPPPKPQHELVLPGHGEVRLDLAYPFLKIAVEYDGDEFHSSDEDRDADSRRRRALEAQGWLVIVVTKAKLWGPGREEWVAELRDAIRERTPVARRTYPPKQRI
jgi:very-short-patch-repair endonuclease